MKRLAVLGGLVVAVLALWTWRSQLFTVGRSASAPEPLALRAESRRRAAELDVVLPAVPAGMERVRGAGGVLVIHYWAPWTRHAREQAAALDSLRRLEALAGLRVVLVCFDPFPSVARYVARHRLRLEVLLDVRHEMRRSLPCPSVPFTYVFDSRGRVAVEQAGEIDWLGARSRTALHDLLAEPRGPEPPPPPL